ncbi:DUF3050 domain-containing protein [Pseudobacteriovorax antillogorgiicola]|uniref:Uncharacterized protein n=1 Tax=Pseudobacteriovorax antillogorgiicola TaxID=1513793 RepID=A0A1Y6B589_9BACT|nr:DUF3050 domain-containing protein [Pseudobacteriovorax antillogorgiicola]TCS59242.1 DUF3050 family protein [Pseudobacteriovorax antillogorgiicola]SME90238.1 Protein of unknown function [Pseudobacteriovorax antillogorgiicola]
MSFMTDRYFQMLENHKVYDLVFNRQSLTYFMERHVICVWLYHSLIKSLHNELVNDLKSINSCEQKECLRLITEVILDEVVEDQGDGQIQSHLELYINAMEDIGANIGPVFCFFELIDKEKDVYRALRCARLPEEVQRYCRSILPFLSAPAYQKAAVLFYEGEPYIPDHFLMNIESMLPKVEVNALLDYFESHIEGLKRPGFSASGRLVEILCMQSGSYQSEAERTAEKAMKARLDLWNSISYSLEDYSEKLGVQGMPSLTLLPGGKNLEGRQKSKG